MFSRDLNEFIFYISIKPEGPILIKEERIGSETGSDDKKNKIYFTREWYKGDQEGPVYIPGSTLRGAVMDRATTILPIISKGEEPKYNKEIENELSTNSIGEGNSQDTIKNVYKLSSKMDKLFGNKSQKSRILFEDAFIYDSFQAFKDNQANDCSKLPTLQSIPIDRFTGKNTTIYEMEYSYGKKFYTTVTIKNFEIWQLGLLAYIFRDLFNCDIPIGFGKNRGFGRISAEIMEVHYKQVKRENSNDSSSDCTCIRGIGSLDNGRQETYGYYQQDEIKIKGFKELKSNGIIENPFYKQGIMERDDIGCLEYTNSSIWKLLENLASTLNVMSSEKKEASADGAIL